MDACIIWLVKLLYDYSEESIVEHDPFSMCSFLIHNVENRPKSDMDHFWSLKSSLLNDCRQSLKQIQVEQLVNVFAFVAANVDYFTNYVQCRRKSAVVWLCHQFFYQLAMDFLLEQCVWKVYSFFLNGVHKSVEGPKIFCALSEDFWSIYDNITGRL